MSVPVPVFSNPTTSLHLSHLTYLKKQLTSITIPKYTTLYIQELFLHEKKQWKKQQMFISSRPWPCLTQVWWNATYYDSLDCALHVFSRHG